jgi:hypothetical protein
MRFVDFNIESDLQIGDYENKKITLNSSSSKKSIKFQVPRMYMPFGVSGFTPQVGPTKYNIDFSMKGWDEHDNYVKAFYEFVKKLENTIIASVESQSVEIFGKKMDQAELRKMFNSNIKESAEREPKFRVKVDTNTVDNTIKFPIYDSNENEISCEASNGLYARHSGTAIVELGNVYFMNKMFGITWRTSQLKVFEPQRLKGFQFID